MENSGQLELVMRTLYEWAVWLCDGAGETIEDADAFWREIKGDTGLLREFAYYHDNKEFLCEYKIEDITLADIMIWQLDHFRAYMDRINNDNKSNFCKLILSTFRAMISMKENPDKVIAAFRDETGTDLAGGWTIN